MMSACFNLDTPVALIVFNRPEETSRVFAAIREARPQQLLVIADGPRSSRSGELELCARVRQIVEQVDWQCNVLHNYSDTNLGCRLRVSSGLDWLFDQVENAIILEDDCLPDPTFFRFCQEMLDLYRNNEKIMMISGSNLLGEWKSTAQSYHFSAAGGIWGWASWRRAWQYYDVEMALWSDSASRLKVSDVLGGGELYRIRSIDFDRTVVGHIDTWDYQWSFAQLLQSGLAVVSSVNLISNIGFNVDATHTVNPRTLYANAPATPCQFPLQINLLESVDQDYDAAVLKLARSERPLLLKLSDFLRLMYGYISLRKYLLL
jgi:hypothetical protein